MHRSHGRGAVLLLAQHPPNRPGGTYPACRMRTGLGRAVQRKRLLEPHGRPVFSSNLKPERPVFRTRKIRHSNLASSPPVVHGCQAPDHVSPQQLAMVDLFRHADNAPLGQERLNGAGEVGGDAMIRAVYERRTRCSNHMELALEFSWKPQIVRVTKGEIPTMCRRDAGVSRSRWAPAIRPADEANPRIASSQLFGDRRRAIRRTIVDNNEFK